MKQGKKIEGKTYTKRSRFNLVISYEQYLFLLEHRQKARDRSECVKYKELAASWGIPPQYLAKAMNRGIKQYDERIKAEQRSSDNRQPVPVRRMERRTECCPLGLWSKSAEARRAILAEYTEGGAIRRGYSPLVRVEYFED